MSPSPGVNANTRTRLRSDLRKIQRGYQVTTLWVTNDPIEAMAVADRVAVLRDGSITQIGTAIEVYHQPVSHFVAELVGGRPMNFLAASVASDGDGAWITGPGFRLRAWAPALSDLDVVDTTVPVITLVSADPQVIEVGGVYVELGATALDSFDGDLTGSIVIDSSAVNMAVLGSYVVTYDVTDSSGNAAIQVTRTVDVVDTTVPVITLVGADPQMIEVGGVYVELGATALDDVDGDITGSIVIDSSAVNMAVLGSYVVTYDVTDSSGNAAIQVTRTVDVVDTTAPVITLVGADPQTIGVGSAYVELGATAFDSYDGDLIASIVIDATGVNTAAIGNYLVTYDVADTSGNAVQAIRLVVVADLNVRPTARNDQYEVVHGRTLNIAAAGVLANDNDVDGDVTVARLTTGPTFGAVILRADGSFEYVSSDDPYENLDSFAYEAVDPSGAVSSAVVTISVTNDAPVAMVDVVFMREDQSILVDPLANDIDPDGDPLVLGATLVGSAGRVVRDPSGGVVVTPPADFNGLIEVTYEVVDDVGGVGVGQILVTVSPVNDDPDAAGDFVTVNDYVPHLIDVLANDTDRDGDRLAIVEVGVAEHGTVRLTAEGELEYQAEPAYVGTDTFEYTIGDGAGGFSSATVVAAVTEDAFKDGEDLAKTLGIAVVPLSVESEDATPFSLGSLLSVDAVSLLVGTFWQSAGALRLPLTLLLLAGLVVIALGRLTQLPLLLGLQSRPRYGAVLLDQDSTLDVWSIPHRSGKIVDRLRPTSSNLQSDSSRTMIAQERWIPIATPNGGGWVQAANLTLERSLETFLDDKRPVRLAQRFAEVARQGDNPRRVIGRRGLMVVTAGGVERIARNDIARAAGSQSDVGGTLRSFLSALGATADPSTGDRHSAGALMPPEFQNFHYMGIQPENSSDPWLIYYEYVGFHLYMVGIARDV